MSAPSSLSPRRRRAAAKPPPSQQKPKPTSRGGYTTDRVVPPTSWTRCHAYMERKVRFCHGQCVPNSHFCGAHQPHHGDRPRVPCPYDPSHTVYADMVEAHLPKCPKYVELQQQKQQPFYCQECNTGGCGDFFAAGCTSTSSSGPHCEDGTAQPTKTNTKNLEWAQQVALRVIAVHQEIFAGGEPSDCNGKSSLVAVQQVTLAAIQDAIPLLDLGVAELDAGLDRAVTACKIKSGGMKHLQQQASFIGHLRRVGALEPLLPTSSPSSSSPSHNKKAKTAACGHDRSEETHSANVEAINITKQQQQQHSRHRTILEVGAGRGITGLLVAGVSAACRRSDDHHTTKLVLVERDGARGGRADTTARRGTIVGNKPQPSSHDTTVATTAVSSPTAGQYAFDVSNLPCQRIKCDLAHVQLHVALVDRTNKVPRKGDDETGNVMNGQDNSNNNDELIIVAKHLCGCGTDYALKSLLPLRHNISTLVMATCCHGACNWHDYVGRDYVRRVMVTKETDNENLRHGCDDRVLQLSEFGEDEFKLLQLWSAGTVKVLDTRSKKMESKSDASASSSLSAQTERDDDEHRPAPVPVGLEEGGTNVYGVTKIVESLGLVCGEQGLGRACQRIIDYGRREFINNELLQFGDDGTAELIYYVSDSITPQNAMLIAARREKFQDDALSGKTS